MDRPSQEPPDRAEAPSVAPDSPLSFPVEAPKVAGVEPGAGSPLSFPAEAEAARDDPPVTPLPFPVAHLPGAAPTPPPAEPAQPTPVPEAPAGTPQLLRFLPPALTAAAALMATGGLFLPLFRLQQHVSVRQRAFEARLTLTQTVWGSRIEIPGQEAVDQASAPVGIPVILAVVLLAVAAFTAFARSRRGRWLIAAGAFFTGGVVVTVGMIGPGWSAMADGLDFEVVTTAGMWLLIGAAVSAAAAAVVAALPAGNRDWADPALAYADTPTPPSDVAITVLPPDQQPG